MNTTNTFGPQRDSWW